MTCLNASNTMFHDDSQSCTSWSDVTVGADPHFPIFSVNVSFQSDYQHKNADAVSIL